MSILSETAPICVLLCNFHVSTFKNIAIERKDGGRAGTAVGRQDDGAVGKDEEAFDGILVRSCLDDRSFGRGSMIGGVRSSTIDVSARRLTIRRVGRLDDRCDGRTVGHWDGEKVCGGGGGDER